MGQYHSPYLAMGNNPMSMVDPTGGDAGVYDPACGCIPSSNDVIIKPRDPYGFFSGQGHFYQTKQMDANGDESSAAYNNRITPDQEAANKQRMQDEARDHAGNSLTTLQQNQYNNKTTPWQWDDPKPKGAWDYVMTREENNSIAMTELNLLSFAIPVGELFQAFRGVTAFARAGKWAGQVLSKSEMAGVVGKGVANGGKGLWVLTKEGASVIKNHRTFGTIYKSSSDGLWWAVDKAGHGGSKFKVFTESNKGLEWFRDADKFGNFIINKHKSSTGTLIPWGQLSTVR